MASAMGAAAIVLTAASAQAAPPAAGPAPASPGPETADLEALVDRAIASWREGDWTAVRDLLEPLVRDADLEDEFLNESALRYLAEATLLDPGLGEQEAKDLADGYIDRLLERNAEWQPPSGLHGRQFYDAVARVRSGRDAQLAEACRGQLLACEADLAELEVDYGAAQERITTLQEDLANEDVFVTEVVRRNRGLAFLPLGIGHFVNGDERLNRALGGTFLALETLSGIAGLGLIIYRNAVWGCVRTNGLNPDSLKCADVPDPQVVSRNNEIAQLRRVETGMGWVFLGSVVLDLALAQLLFESVEIVERGQRTRSELDAELESEAAPPGARPPSAQSSRLQPSVRLRVRPSTTIVRGGAGFGVTLQF